MSNFTFGFNGNVNNYISGLTFKGAWNANTNAPFLQSGVGVAGEYYIVSVAGTTNLDGTFDWQVGDWAIFEGATNMWQKIDNHDIVSYNTIQDEGISLPQQNVLDFQGGGVTASNGIGKTIVTIPGTDILYYGSFYDTTTQSVGANTSVPMKLNTTDLTCTNGVSIVNDLSGNPTKIITANAGKYNIQFSAQLRKTSGGQAEQIYIWFRQDGLDIPFSNTTLTLANNGDLLVAAWNIYANMTAGGNIQIMWRTSLGTVQIYANTTIPGLPEIPSVITTINKIS